MFKTDQPSLERLSFLDEKELSTLYKTISESLRRNLLSCSPQEAKRVLEGLEKAGQLRLDRKIYAFGVHNEYALETGGKPEGVYAYLRQGDLLKPLFDQHNRDSTPQVPALIPEIKKQGATHVYTGSLRGFDFLGLTHDMPGEEILLLYELDPADIQEFNDHGIQVITLDKLI